MSPHTRDFLDHSLHLRCALEALTGVTGHVLEIGCGSGRFIASVAAQRPDLMTHGCDLSSRALQEVRRHATTRFVRGSALQLPYRSRALQGVLMVDVLEHLPDLQQGLAEVRRVLAPEGTFHLVFPCEGSRATLHGWSKVLRSLKRQHAGHLQQIGHRSLLNSLREAGLVPTDVKYSYHALGQLYDLAVFAALGLGFDVHGARRTQVESAKSSPVKLVRAGLSRLLYAESRLLSRVSSGMTVHVTCR